ncbi:MAG TPA: 30S ribosomal protein S4 [Acidimicrobiia bacterium]|jgi:small subunit ribosomal protein S4|nr:30S ribosomal protein S4 [Acidimicrobiia bacterium]
MARYTGPKVKISRRLGVNIYENEKGARALDARPYPPGEHGRDRQRLSEYALQLREKQKLRFAYGVMERQFRRLYQEAARRPGITGHNLLGYLELRVDNVVYRSGWARTRPQARQFVSHGLVTVNGKRVTIPSLRLRPGDVVALGSKTADMIAIRHNTLDRIVPAWLERNGEATSTTVVGVPMREQIDVPVDEAMVVELYSR